MSQFKPAIDFSNNVVTGLPSTSITPGGTDRQAQVNNAGALDGSPLLVGTAGNIGVEGTALNANSSIAITKSNAPVASQRIIQVALTTSLPISSCECVRGTANSTHTSGTNGQTNGATFTATHSGAGGTATFIYGADLQGTLLDGICTNLWGARNKAVQVGGVSAICIGSLCINQLAGGVATQQNIIQAQNIYSAGTVVDLRGLFIGGWTGNPPATNLDGILIDATIDAAAATNKFAIRSLSVNPVQVAGDIKLSDAAKGFYVGGTKVVGAQGVAVADAAGGAIIDVEARAQLNALLAKLRTHGLIAT
jgi:hypothetical protein